MLLGGTFMPCPRLARAPRPVSPAHHPQSGVCPQGSCVCMGLLPSTGCSQRHETARCLGSGPAGMRADTFTGADPAHPACWPGLRRRWRCPGQMPAIEHDVQGQLSMFLTCAFLLQRHSCERLCAQGLRARSLRFGCSHQRQPNDATLDAASLCRTDEPSSRSLPSCHAHA